MTLLLRIPWPFVQVLSLATTCSAAMAGAVIDWHTFRWNNSTTLTGQGTNDPVFGSYTQPADGGAHALGYTSTPLSLANVGDQIIFHFDVRFNNLEGIGGAYSDAFRFGLFELNGAPRYTADNGLMGDHRRVRGYYVGVTTPVNFNGPGEIRERFGPDMGYEDLHPFADPAAFFRGNAGGTAVPLVSSVNDDGAGPLYSGTMILELQTGGLALSGAFSGNGGANSFSFFDTSPVTLTYDAVGFLIGGWGVDQTLLEDVTVSVVPEPISIVLAALGATFLLRRSQRRSLKK